MEFQNLDSKDLDSKEFQNLDCFEISGHSKHLYTSVIMWIFT